MFGRGNENKQISKKGNVSKRKKKFNGRKNKRRRIKKKTEKVTGKKKQRRNGKNRNDHSGVKKYGPTNRIYNRGKNKQKKAQNRKKKNGSVNNRNKSQKYKNKKKKKKNRTRTKIKGNTTKISKKKNQKLQRKRKRIGKTLHIPPRIRKQLKNMLKSGRVKTHYDFEHAFSVTGLERSISVGGSGSTEFARVKPQIVNNMQVELEPSNREMSHGASMIEGPERIVGEDETNPCKRKGYINCSFIDTPEHSIGDCEASNHCVPLEFQRHELEYNIPECVVLKQCMGHCCGIKYGCVANWTQPVFVKVRKFVFTGMRGDKPNFEFLHDFYSEMEEHLDCKCAGD